MQTAKPSILVTRAIFPEVLDHLAKHFVVESNPADADWDPSLRMCANMAVGFNNFDVQAMRNAGVMGSNAPDVLTETTADFGFALLLATARRLTEGEPHIHPGHLTLPNVVLTPHIASATTGTRRAMTMLAADNLIAFWTQGRARTPVVGEHFSGTIGG